MKKETIKKIEELTIELTKQLSVVETADEVRMAEKVHELMSQMEYFRDRPQNLYFVPVKNDKLGRKSVIAIVNGLKKPSKKTIVMIGHIDTVGTSDYGSLQKFANYPSALATKLKEVELHPAVRKDLDSGDYLFGRGIFDMKSGDAIIMALLEEISDEIENFEGNLIYGAVCDEEGNSGGMLNLIPELVRLKEEKGYEYLALLDTDYTTSEYEGDENRYIYVGTVGKLMPSFYIVGKETHVGESFKGLDPNKIASEITRRINLNPEFCDVAEGEVTLPPVTLKQRDLKSEYSVQSAKTSNLFFNYATHNSTPDIILKKMVEVGKECFQEVIDVMNTRYMKFCDMAHRPFKRLPWVARTIAFDDLYAKVKEEIGEELDDMVKDFSEEVNGDDSIEQIDKSLKIVQYVHSLWSDKTPIIVVYFTPPYYPHVYIDGKNEKEKNLINAVKKAVKEAGTDTEYNIVYKKFFPYISDLSYGAAPKDENIIRCLKGNMPGFGITYDLPIEDMQNLDLPVLDIGPYGKDAHKFTERIEKKYTFEVAPELVFKTIMNLLQ